MHEHASYRTNLRVVDRYVFRNIFMPSSKIHFTVDEIRSGDVSLRDAFNEIESLGERNAKEASNARLRIIDFIFLRSLITLKISTFVFLKDQWWEFPSRFLLGFSSVPSSLFDELIPTKVTVSNENVTFSTQRDSPCKKSLVYKLRKLAFLTRIISDRVKLWNPVFTNHKPRRKSNWHFLKRGKALILARTTLYHPDLTQYAYNICIL